VRCPTLIPLLLVCAPAVAGAQEAPLTWTAPRGCLTAADVIARSREAGLDADHVPSWTARAVVRRARGQWALDMEIRVGGDVVPQRRTAATCRALVQLAGVDLALVLNAHIPPPVPVVPVVPVVPAVVQARPPPEPVRQVITVEPPRERVRAWRMVVGVMGGVEVGLLPRAAVMGALRAGVSWDHVRVEVRGAVSEEVTVTRTETVGGAATRFGAALRAVDLSARGCGQETWGRWTLAGCAGVSAGWVDAVGVGQLVQAEATRVPWVGGVVAGEVWWRAGRWVALGASVEGGAFGGGRVLLYNSLPVNDPSGWRGSAGVGVLGVW
jgi:hypothetical protein